MSSVSIDRTPYFPLSVPFSALARKRYELVLEPPRPSSAEALYYLRLAGAKLPTTVGGGAQLNLLAQLNRALRKLGERFLSQRISEGLCFDLAGLQPSLQTLIELFPPHTVLSGEPLAKYLSVTSDGYRKTLLELFLLAVQNDNPATTDLRSLFDDTGLQQRCDYRQLLSRLDTLLTDEEGIGSLGTSLTALLWAPIKASPHSLADQLNYVRLHWAEFLPADLLLSIDSAFDVLASEEQQRGWGKPQVPVPHYPAATRTEPEAERFSPDTDWMPRTVLIAKTIYVWLDQLSSQYGRPIHRLSQIPDAELDLLAKRGFTALWLIGLWERSPASKQIKRIMGNPEAEASAYSLYDYTVAEDLGGQQDLDELHDRCWQRGLRLACDVVPNHTGIVSRWMEEHPDWFVQLDYPPFPCYRFDGPDLSSRDDVTLQIENGYFDHSDAAVVFQHIDRTSGRVRYIYHGNDGTHTPWNDTAQLNFLMAEVREAMIQTILQVARTFKVIRFDAAMTLAKKHYQRLWFPRPGGGAGVPSRAEHWMEAEEFDRIFPVEFWREVVDRVAAEVPDTLLLAEAFWLMEGFFVRTLGMHRVYNSAFMHMFKNEDNGKYQQLLRNTLEFNPEILKRFVNFMNNPDEATAVEQFGRGDKYFGVAVILVTLPGLPMFGHGQIEGFAEKYGMEYRRAYWEETVDEGFVAHHETQIFPLLHQRHLFSEAELFELYPFETAHGVNNDVFAYSNGCGQQRALVVYHNRSGSAAGWVRHSVPKARLGAHGGRQPSTTTLTAALGVNSDSRHYYRFRDQHSGQHYLRSGAELEEKGLFFQLEGYQYQVFVDFCELIDTDGSWSRLCRQLNGQPVSDLDLELKRLHLEPLLSAFDRLLQDPFWDRLLPSTATEEATAELSGLKTEPLLGGFEAFIGQLQPLTGPHGDSTELVAGLASELQALSKFSASTGRKPDKISIRRELCRILAESLNEVLPAYLLLHRLGDLTPGDNDPTRVIAWLDDYLLREPLVQCLINKDQLLLIALIRWQDLLAKEFSLSDLVTDDTVRDFLQVHEYEGHQWMCAERLSELASGLFAISALVAATQETGAALNLRLERLWEQAQKLVAAGKHAGYRLDRLQSLR
ncbi:hypothetical protein A7E78_12450 [Syntrophotalea acetylenivorans]|uniref:Glycosyl hydrolase family 13 catalytic domain-containing protein n=1 Tax=Syntrophotalea acetylenivorans TaxID=1842532 RepID=A0A1L3GRL2_9BACT|nr:alpha-amylase family glycosyl hydrolase [Syntrophotalea acetylenivorans]APG28582.1 hypothetical protein A7E78_12450 [Syntrophotalea acetylenivorans]